MAPNMNPLPGSGEVMMPIPEEAALRQIEIEAMRGILDNLKRINDNQVEQTKALHSIDKRLVRVEESNVKNELAELKSKVEANRIAIDTLNSERDKRQGAVGLFEWIFRHWPGVFGFLVLVYVIVADKAGALK